ncbi:MAG: NADH-quinone oxidoreductase subunit NuoH [Cyanobacteria bacterium REEB65]|nr:NADH-quinone oxidoreductase subunit NuoH [Cyanobacteria bacterium REEB65]
MGAIASILVVFAVVLPAATFMVLWERVFLGMLTQRPGPNRVGPRGLLQTIADAIKLVSKEDFDPANADHLLFFWAPVVFMMPSFLVYAVVPFGKFGASYGPALVSDLRVGLFFLVAVFSIHTVAILMAGWGSNNKYSLLGGIRGVAQAISYELPLVLSFLGVVLLTGSLSTVDIVKAQSGGIWNWYVVAQPVAFGVYLICSIAEVNRVPFDIPEAESELVSGYNTEYSGMRFAMFFLAEYASLFATSAIATTVFLGGWTAPFPEPAAIAASPLGYFVWSALWFTLKVFLLITLAIWIRGTLPRLRADQLMAFAWKFLVPVVLANLFITGLIGFWDRDGSGIHAWWPVAGALWTALFACIGYGWATAPKIERRRVVY